MRLKQTGYVYRKELLDILRDRRTIISMVVVPLIVIPLLMFGMAELMLKMVRKAEQETFTVMILGSENAPVLAEQIRNLDTFAVVPTDGDYEKRIEDKELRVAIEFPPNFENVLTAGDHHTDLAVLVYHYEGEIRSGMAAEKLKAVLRDYHVQVVQNRLAERNVAPEVLQPFEIRPQNVASPEKVGGAILGGIIPYVIILLALTGAMYPAIDLTAGEKERGTIETILASPVARSSLAVGKFLTVLTASVATALLSLLSLATVLRLAPTLGQIGADGGVPAFAVSGKGIVAVLAMIVPVAVMFSAALLAIALLAKSFKEAQSYISPLMIIVILPAVAGLLPGIELDAGLALVPILNVSLVSKEILSGTFNWHWIGLILASSTVYAGVALAVAAFTFQRESVLFRT